MATTTITSLPEELLLEVFEYLDRPPPSELNARKEPTLSVTSSPHQDIKHISLICKRWRRIVLPVLYKYSQLRLDTDPRESWQSCTVCGTHPFLPDTETDPDATCQAYHKQLFTDATLTSRTLYAPQDEILGRPNWRENLRTACQWYHCVSDYLTFLHTHNLEFCVQSLAVMTNRSDNRHERFPHRLAANQDYRYRAAAALWRHVLQKINPTRVMVLASPADLACLTNCAIDMFGDWAFSDMAYHILDLRIDAAKNVALEQTLIDLNTLEYVPSQYPGIAESSLLGLKPWTEIGLNEGSFLTAYGTYHFFEHGAPSLVASIEDCLSSPYQAGRAQQQNMHLPAVRKLVYTAILPFASHVDFRGLLPRLDELDCKLAPDPQSGILTDKNRVGKAQLDDCWQEFFSSYSVISQPFRTGKILPNGQPRLKRFICRDFQNPMLVEDLDETFLWLCMPCWAEMKPGVFERQAEIPNYEQAPIGF
ncbi:Putative F-box domain-containing protein [Septoria linicola]|uniref:F-box domain-containing protein n=1 Tax=Septoria linicola TaxID=215465 RepID=A0A9Q9ALH4_9PEZI|nr:Putative F-box domain-containing protein [Septoria linicola]